MSTFETFPVLIVYRGESGISRRHIYIIAAVSAAGFWVSMSRTSKTVIASACFDTSDHGPGIPNPTRLAAPQHEGFFPAPSAKAQTLGAGFRPTSTCTCVAVTWFKEPV